MWFLPVARQVTIVTDQRCLIFKMVVGMILMGIVSKIGIMLRTFHAILTPVMDGIMIYLVILLLVQRNLKCGINTTAVLRKPGRTAGMGAVMGARRLAVARLTAGRAVHPAVPARIAGRGTAAGDIAVRAMPGRLWLRP